MPESKSQLALLKWMFEDVRDVTLSGVDHLSKEQLFRAPLEGEFSIGSYLMHLAECDVFWLEVLSGIKQPDEIKVRAYSDSWFDPPPGSAKPPESPLEVKEYFDVMALTRKTFLDYLLSMDDSQLEEEMSFQGRSGERKFTKKWIIYHLLEHEAHHRGQMFMLIRKAGWNKK